MTMLRIEDQFAPVALAKNIRAQFDARFGSPLIADGRRFVWDYWNVPGQYNLLRTVPGQVFAEKQWRSFTDHLVRWGRENLGCHTISEPWLSCYVEGSGQGFHGDRPHGPFAFVWSLTKWKARRFTGGETLLLRPEILDYWRQSSTAFAEGMEGMNEAQVLERVAPEFNRLTVFDPRIPHAVSQVRGASDVCEGRLVVHGWFVQPRPFIEGPVGRSEVSRLIDGLNRALPKTLGQGIGGVQGHLIWRLTIGATGRVTQIRCLVDTLQGDTMSADAVKRQVIVLLREGQFRRQRSGSRVVLPMGFEN